MPEVLHLFLPAGDDRRTTLMIKNIPNKYTQRMLLNTIDESFKGTYDFFYLPIDFKNKCNVGYAFINMVQPGYIVPFVQKFDHKKWDKFNSEKVCQISYARIQVRRRRGEAAEVPWTAHQMSSTSCSLRLHMVLLHSAAESQSVLHSLSPHTLHRQRR